MNRGIRTDFQIGFHKRGKEKEQPEQEIELDLVIRL